MRTFLTLLIFTVTIVNAEIHSLSSFTSFPPPRSLVPVLWMVREKGEQQQQQQSDPLISLLPQVIFGDGSTSSSSLKSSSESSETSLESNQNIINEQLSNSISIYQVTKKLVPINSSKKSDESESNTIQQQDNSQNNRLISKEVTEVPIQWSDMPVLPEESKTDKSYDSADNIKKHLKEDSLDATMAPQPTNQQLITETRLLSGDAIPSYLYLLVLSQYQMQNLPDKFCDVKKDELNGKIQESQYFQIQSASNELRQGKPVFLKKDTEYNKNNSTINPTSNQDLYFVVLANCAPPQPKSQLVKSQLGRNSNQQTTYRFASGGLSLEHLSPYGEHIAPEDYPKLQFWGILMVFYVVLLFVWLANIMRILWVEQGGSRKNNSGSQLSSGAIGSGSGKRINLNPVIDFDAVSNVNMSTSAEHVFGSPSNKSDSNLNSTDCNRDQKYNHFDNNIDDSNFNSYGIGSSNRTTVHKTVAMISSISFISDPDSSIVLPLHYLISLTVFISLLEAISWYVSMKYLDVWGIRSVPMFLCATFITVCKQGLCFGLLLLVAKGWGVTKNRLAAFEHRRCFCYVFTFIVLDSIRQFDLWLTGNSLQNATGHQILMENDPNDASNSSLFSYSVFNYDALSSTYEEVESLASLGSSNVSGGASTYIETTKTVHDQSWLQFMILLPTAIVLASLYMGIVESLNQTIAELRALKQTYKLQIYRKLRFFLILILSLTCLSIFIDVTYIRFQSPTIAWRYLWIFTDAESELCFLSILLVIMYLWMPLLGSQYQQLNDSSSNLGARTQLPTNEHEANELEFGLDMDDQSHQEVQHDHGTANQNSGNKEDNHNGPGKKIVMLE